MPPVAVAVVTLGIVVLTVLGCRPVLAAEDYRQVLEQLLSDHKRVAAARADLQGAQATASHARSAWYPDLSFTASVGHQSMTYTNGTVNTDLDTRGITFGLRQTLWDFGATDATIKKAEIGVQQSEASLTQVAQDLLLEGLTAIINLERTRRAVAFAEQSVTNVQKQTGLEESRVELGGGFTSDVLQAKSQLAGAQARLVRARGAEANAVNRFRAVFGYEPPPVDRGRDGDREGGKGGSGNIAIPYDLLSSTLDAAIASGLKYNRQLEVLRLTAEGSRAEIDRVRATEFYPNIHALAQHIQEYNPDGVTGTRTQEVVKLEMTFQFNTGLGSFYAVDAAADIALSAGNKYAELRTLIEEQVRNAWQNLENAQENAGYLDNQVTITSEFLRLAREERLQGRRSLIDVLTGETSLINAQSDAASAHADVAIAAFTLFRAEGQLDLAIIR